MKIFQLLKEERGVALLMVMGAITILLAIIASFTFETEVNKLKVYNRQDVLVARLMAESGLNIAIARLKLFKEALNIIEKDENKKGMVDLPSLNQIWSLPFRFPIPSVPNANIIQRNAIAEFQKNSLLEGQMEVTIQNASSLININLLRFNAKKTTATGEGPNVIGGGNPDDPDGPMPSPNDSIENSDSNEDGLTTIQQKLTELMEQRLEDKKQNDDDYDAKYGSTTSALLIKELKFFVSDKDSYSDPDNTEIEARYSSTTPKHAPLSTLSELYLLQGWKDNHIELIKNDITVHGNRALDVNKISKTGLKFIIPDITEEQSKEFFKYRDKVESPHYFSSFKDFSDYVVNQAHFIDQSNLDSRVQQLEKAGIEIGATGSLFKVVSTGRHQKANFTLTAYISIPAESPPPRPKKRPNDEGKCTEDYELDPKIPDVCNPKVEKDAEGKPKKPPLTYLEPRVVEIIVN